MAAVRSMHNVLGGTVDPFAAYLLLRGMKTLGIRVNQQNCTALEIAHRLEAHPRIQRVSWSLHLAASYTNPGCRRFATALLAGTGSKSL